MPPIPPLPLPPPIGNQWAFFGVSATIASVVISRPATDAASCSAVRNDLRRLDDRPATPACRHTARSERRRSRMCPATCFREPCRPRSNPPRFEFSAIWRIGASRALEHDVDARLLIGVVAAGACRSRPWRATSATPPPATRMPSSTAALAAPSRRRRGPSSP